MTDELKPAMTDHERGCEGRSYTCTCGYDAERDAAIAALRAENERLQKYAARATAEKTGLLEAIKHHSGHDHGIMGIRSLVDRATAAEARLAEAMKVMEPIYDMACEKWSNPDDIEEIRAARAFVEREKSNG